MKTRFSRWAAPTLALALAGFVLLGTAPQAHATLTLVAIETGGPTLVAADGKAAGVVVPIGALGAATATTVADSSAPGTSVFEDNALALGAAGAGVVFGDFTVFGSLSTTNVPGTTFSQLISTSLRVINNTAVTHEITLWISANGFTMPSNPILNATAIGAFNVVDGTTGTITTDDKAHALAFFDATNTLFGTGVKVQDFSFTATPSPVGPIGYSDNAGPVLAGTATVPYSLTVQLIFSVAGNNELSGRNNSITGVAAVPEPATLAMACSALPLIGFAAWRKRRQSA
jgi:hypothetical protein